MNNENVNCAKKVALEEKMRDAMIDGSFNKKLSVFRMEAVDLEIAESEFTIMVENCKKKSNEADNITEYVKKKGWIYVLITAIFIVLEWFLHIGWGYKVLLTFLTIVIMVFVIAIVYKCNSKKHM